MYKEESSALSDTMGQSYYREPVGMPLTGLPPRSTSNSPSGQRRLVAHHSPTVSRRYPVQSLRSRAWSPASDSDSSEDKGYLMKRFLDPLGEQQRLERSRSVSPVPFSMRPGSPFYEAAVGGRGTLERGDGDPTQPHTVSEPGHITVPRSPCRSPGLRHRRVQEGSRQFVGRSVGPEMTRRSQEQQIQRGPGRKDPLAHQLSISSGSSLDEALSYNLKRVPLPAPASMYSSRGLVTTETYVSPCPSPTRLGTTTRTSAQDNVDYTKAQKVQAKVTLELPAGGLTVDPIPSPCPSPIIFRDIKEEDEGDGSSSQGRRSQSKSPRPRYRPEDSRQPGHVSPAEEPRGSSHPSPTRSKPIVMVGDVPFIQIQDSSPKKSGLHQSPESAFRKPMKEQTSLEIARERRHQRRSHSRSPSPMVVESSDTQGPETVTVGFRPISPATTTTAPLPVAESEVASPPTFTSAFGGAELVGPVASPAVTGTSLEDTFPDSHESRVQQMKVVTLDLLRMVFIFFKFGCHRALTLFVQ